MSWSIKLLNESKPWNVGHRSTLKTLSPARCNLDHQHEPISQFHQNVALKTRRMGGPYLVRSIQEDDILGLIYPKWRPMMCIPEENLTIILTAHAIPGGPMQVHRIGWGTCPSSLKWERVDLSLELLERIRLRYPLDFIELAFMFDDSKHRSLPTLDLAPSFRFLTRAEKKMTLLQEQGFNLVDLSQAQRMERAPLLREFQLQEMLALKGSLESCANTPIRANTMTFMDTFRTILKEHSQWSKSMTGLRNMEVMSVVLEYGKILKQSMACKKTVVVSEEDQTKCLAKLRELLPLEYYQTIDRKKKESREFYNAHRPTIGRSNAHGSQSRQCQGTFRTQANAPLATNRYGQFIHHPTSQPHQHQNVRPTQLPAYHNAQQTETGTSATRSSASDVTNNVLIPRPGPN